MRWIALQIYTAGVIPCLKDLDWSEFLARPCVAPPMADRLDALRHEAILISGAGGLIGGALAKRLARLAPAALVLLDSSECNLWDLQREFAKAGLTTRTVFVLGNVSDRILLEEIFAMHAPRLVFHAVAFKHVPLIEGQPFAAIENNIFGTLSLIMAAEGARIILLSTDKAAAPVSMMGATKRVAEQVVISAGGTALRLGNVLASRGSVAEIFARQIVTGMPVTITSPLARRYFLTIDEAVNVLLAAAVEPERPSILAPALPAPQLVVDLGCFMARALAPGRTIPIEFIGTRVGDKETEQFWTAIEIAKPAESGKLLLIESPLPASAELHSALVKLHAAVDARDLPGATALLCGLAPDYEPSPALRELADLRRSRVVA